MPASVQLTAVMTVSAQWLSVLIATHWIQKTFTERKRCVLECNFVANIRTCGRNRREMQLFCVAEVSWLRLINCGWSGSQKKQEMCARRLRSAIKLHSPILISSFSSFTHPSPTNQPLRLQHHRRHHHQQHHLSRCNSPSQARQRTVLCSLTVELVGMANKIKIAIINSYRLYRLPAVWRQSVRPLPHRTESYQLQQQRASATIREPPTVE